MPHLVSPHGVRWLVEASRSGRASNPSKVDLVMSTVGASRAQTSGVLAPRGTKLAAWLLSLALATTGMWFILQNRAGDRTDAGSGSSTATSNPAASDSMAGRQTLEDAGAGYQLKYPESWTEVPGAGTPAGAEGHVIRIDGKNAFSIQTFPLDRPVAISNLGDMRAVTDAILSSPNAKLTVLDVRQVEIAGLPAIYYLYYFPSGKKRGIHAHYFIFDGARMHALIFQIVPATDFADYAGQFDQVVASFEPMAR